MKGNVTLRKEIMPTSMAKFFSKEEIARRDAEQREKLRQWRLAEERQYDADGDEDPQAGRSVGHIRGGVSDPSDF